jgi:hypothetical protein
VADTVGPDVDLGLRTPSRLRIVLVAAGAFAGLQGVLLFLFPAHTHLYFAWEVQPSMTPAFIGASSIAGTALVWTAAKQDWWVQTRVSIVAPWLFITTTGVVTLVHLDRFHWDTPVLTAQLGLWGWMFFYAVFPVWILVVAISVLWLRVPDPPRRRPLPGPLRTIMLVVGIPVAVLGVLMLIAPERVLDHWPWDLTVLTGRVLGAWMLSNGAIITHGALENDLDRLFPFGVTNTIAGTLLLTNAVLHAGDLEVGSVGGLLYLAYATSVLFFGAFTLWLRRTVPQAA